MPPKRLPWMDHKIKAPFICLLSPFQCSVLDFGSPKGPHFNTAFHLLYHGECPLKV